MKTTRLKQISSDQQFMLELYETYSAFLFHCAWKYTSSQADCEDIIQDALVRLLRNISTLRRLTEKQTFTYLSLTVRSVYADHAKSRAAREIPTEDESISRMRPAQSHEEWASIQWNVEVLRENLSGRDWQLLELKYITGCTDGEIAAELGCAPASVRSMVTRARQRARLLLSGGTRKEG